MTDTITGPKATVGFKRSVRVREYENAEASIFIEVPTEPGDTIEQIVEKIKPTFFAAKVSVFEQLGIEFSITPEQVVMESLEKVLGAVEVAPATEAKAVAAANNTAPSSNAKPAAPTTKAGLWAELAEHPKRYFDNRETKKGKQPDFKRKYTGEGLWATDKEAPAELPPASAWS